jgi:hypothetical protein
VGNEGFLLVSGLHGDGLSLGASDIHWFAILVEFDREIGQMEFVGASARAQPSGWDCARG